MQAFEYATPTTKDQAVQALGSSWGETEVLAGGTDLLSLMKEYVSTPKRVVNIKSISGLNAIKKEGDTVSVGALVSLQELLDHKEFGKWFPSLTQAAEGVTSPQIRSMGTVGGDLCQRPRCWYYRAGFGLMARGPDGEPLVPRGDNRYHAIFGGGPAYFVNPSSLAPALAALGARATLEGPGGKPRTVLVSEFFVSPKNGDQREYVLKSNEILTGLSIPTSAAKSATYEVRQKEALDWPLTAAAVALKMNGKKVESASVVLGHVAPTPWRAAAAENALKGKEISETVAEAAGKAATEGAKPLSGNAYKVRLVQTAVKRAILRATQQFA
jgi:xanthine dehydrogenase YagS FAD-binding subunit